MKYELFYLVGESNKSKLEEIKENMKQTIIKEGGSFLEPQLTKERKMSYEIKNEIRGIYVAQRFETPEKESEKYNPELIHNVIKKFNLNSDILRFILVRADELPELSERKKEEQKMKPKFETREDRTKQKPEIKKIKEKSEENKKEDKETQEDIDKKLEEILKI